MAPESGARTGRGTVSGVFVSVLGPVRIVLGGEERTIRSERRRHLLAALSASVGEAVSTDRLTEAIWGDDPPSSAPAALQVHVSDLRSLLDPDRPARQDGGHIVTVPGGYRLDLRPGQLDWTRALGLAEAGRAMRARGRHRDAEAVLAEALRRWSGPAYEDSRDAVPGHARWLDDTRLDVEDDLLAAALAAGGHERIASDVARRAAEEPFRERRAALLVLAHYRCGRQREALAAYEDVRRRLRDELGCDPGPELVALQRAVLDHDPGLGTLTLAPGPGEVRQPPVSGSDRLVVRGEPAALAVVEAVLWSCAQVADRGPQAWTFVGDGDAMTDALADERLHTGDAAEVVTTAARAPRPGPPVDLVGRDRERATVRDALVPGAAVSLVGPPGVGASALAAAAVAGLDPPAVRVTLARGDGAPDLVASIADATGLPRPGRSAARLLAALDGRVLLVDDADAALDQLAVLAGRLRDEARSTTILTTGRRRPGLPDEVVIEVGPLEPDDAVTLLARRAGVDPDPLAPLVERLDRLPLAIELLAPAVRGLGAEAVLERLDRAHGLWRTTGGADLDAAIAWSYEQLSADGARLLGRLSVFAGSFTLDDVEVVAADDDLPADRVAPALAELVDASLVAPQTDVDGLSYRAYAVVRAFARGRLAPDEERAIRRRHAHHVTSVLGRAGRATIGPAARRAQRRIERSRRDLDLAVEWLEASGEPDEHLALAERLTMFWFSTGRLREGRAFTRRALGRGGHPGPRARCLTSAALLAWFQGDYPEVARHLAEAAETPHADPASPLRVALEASLAWIGGDLDRADVLSRDAVERARQRGRPADLLVATVVAGTVAWYRGEAAEAVAWFREVAEIGDRDGFPHLAALARRGESLNLAIGGHLDEAREVVAVAREQADQLGDPISCGQAVAFTGLVELAAGNDSDAERLLREAVTVSTPPLDLFGLFLEACGLLALAGRRGQHRLVLELDGWISATVEATGMPLAPVDREGRAPTVAAAEAALPAAEAAAARHRGRSQQPLELAELLRSP
jgi:DNA-binding SARP family transcriptional activator/predicted ATPase